MKARLSKEKLKKTHETVDFALKKNSIAHSNLQSLIEFFFFAIKVIVSERSFFHQLFDSLQLKIFYHYIIEFM